MARPCLTVVVQTDPETGDVDPSAPALFYSAKGYFLGSRELEFSEIRLMAGRRTAELALPPPTSDHSAGAGFGLLSPGRQVRTVGASVVPHQAQRD